MKIISITPENKDRIAKLLAKKKTKRISKLKLSLGLNILLLVLVISLCII